MYYEVTDSSSPVGTKLTIANFQAGIRKLLLNVKKDDLNSSSEKYPIAHHVTYNNNLFKKEKKVLSQIAR